MAQWLRKLTQAQVDECVAMYDGGMSLAPIAAYFGVSRQAMWSLLKKRTTLRPQRQVGPVNHFHRGGPTEDDSAQNMVELPRGEQPTRRVTLPSEGDLGSIFGEWPGEEDDETVSAALAKIS